MMPSATPTSMQAVILTGHGGLDKLSVEKTWPVPSAGPGQILIKVGACGVNNTDINTRIGWYSKSVRGDTNATADNDDQTGNTDDATWSGTPLQLPRIQGADICGEIVGTGDGVSPDRIGERVLVRAMQPVAPDAGGLNCITIGSERDGGFAEYAVAEAQMAATVNSTLSDAELASFPCAYSTAENMLDRINLKSGERVLITGASGGVGSAAVQLAKRRGCTISAISGKSKHDFVREIGAESVIDRDAPLVETFGTNAFDVVVDVVGGPQFSTLLEVLKRGGRYVSAGAIAGPIAELDIRTLYLKDLTLAGSTWQNMEIFDNLVGYIERGEIKPVVSKIYPLSRIADAQTDFISKKYSGKLVLVPDARLQ